MHTTTLWRSSYALIAVLSVLCAACDTTVMNESAHEEAMQVNAPSSGRSTQSNIPSWEEYRAAAVEYSNGVFTVEGDMQFWDESAVRAYYDEFVLTRADKSHDGSSDRSGDKAHVATFRNGTRRVFTPQQAVNIRYCVSDHFINYSTVVADVAAATAEWEQHANINFNHIATEDGKCTYRNSNIDISMVPAPEYWKDSGAMGCATFPIPVGGLAGGCETADGLNPDKKVLSISYESIAKRRPYTPYGVLLHELGHSLGFVHEHPWNESFEDGQGCQIDPNRKPVLEPRDDPRLDLVDEALTEYDRESVMHYRARHFITPRGLNLCPDAIAADFYLSQLDEISIRKLYGIHASWYTAVGVI